MRALQYAVMILLLGTLASSCKKDNENDVSTATADVRDSVYWYSQEMYLWRDRLPSKATFNPTSYQTPEAVMEKVRTYSPLGTNGKNLDRWSFAMTKKDWDNVASGASGDLGMSFGFIAANDLRVAFVYKNSDPGKQGVQRGWQVTSVDGIAATTSNADALSKALFKESMQITFKKPDGTSQTLSLKVASYQTNPVLTRSIISQNGKRIGYIAFGTFLGATAAAELDEAFAYFKSNNVTDLIFDERYNGGGEVELAEKIANLIAPRSVAGKLMYKDTHNQKYTSWNETVNFDKTLPASNLNLSQVVFIATGETASASELLINVLKPYMTVKVVGETTYGKPAGYYPFPVMNYYAFPLAVKQVNANNYGEYYEGLPVDRQQADDVTRNWGDPQELCVKDALSFITTGQFPASSGRLANFNQYAIRAHQVVDLPGVLLRNPNTPKL